jgi:hypothetical protein
MRSPETALQRNPAAAERKRQHCQKHNFNHDISSLVYGCMRVSYSFPLLLNDDGGGGGGSGL